MVAEMLALQPVARRLEELNKQIKAHMDILNVDQVATEAGEVKLVVSETLMVEPAVATSVLGVGRVDKVLKVRKSVSTKLLKAFVEAGEFTDGEFAEIQSMAEQKRSLRLLIKSY